MANWTNISTNFSYFFDNYTCELFEEDLKLALNPFLDRAKMRIVVIVLYCVILSIGAVGNLLVVTAVVRNPTMRTPRNYFIINLASSDFILCTVTVPFTMQLVLEYVWPFGWLMCKFVATLQGVNIFVSTLCITSISLDRFLVILFPTNLDMQNVALLVSFLCVWGISILLALPQGFFATTIRPLETDHTSIFCGRADLEMCREIPALSNIRRIYSICCFIFQYCLPLITIILVYHRLMAKLRMRMSFRKKQVICEEAQREQDARQNRTSVLVILIVVVFAVVWLPINLYNTIVSFFPLLDRAERFGFCHMIGMLSACTNPVLYGVFNQNFNKEFKIILRWKKIRKFLPSWCLKDSRKQRPQHPMGCGAYSTGYYGLRRGSVSAGSGSTTRRATIAVGAGFANGRDEPSTTEPTSRLHELHRKKSQFLVIPGTSSECLTNNPNKQTKPMRLPSNPSYASFNGHYYRSNKRLSWSPSVIITGDQQTCSTTVTTLSACCSVKESNCNNSSSNNSPIPVKKISCSLNIPSVLELTPEIDDLDSVSVVVDPDDYLDIQQCNLDVDLPAS